MKEAREGLSHLVNRVAYAKERIALARQNKPMAVLVSVEDALFLEAFEERADKEDLELWARTHKPENAISWREAKKMLKGQ